MMRDVLLVCVFVALCVIAAAAITPHELVKLMDVGTNLGNTLDAPYEGAWAPKAQPYFFSDFKAAGMKTCRVPIRWDYHTGTSPPYAINATFLDRVAEIVGWSLSQGLITIINSHHDDWLDNVANFTIMLPRFQAIWTQVAARFKDAPDTLLFEVYNEPHVMTTAQLNTMNQAVHAIVRANNPTRIVVFGGLNWMTPEWLLSNWNAMWLPDDTYIMVEVHDYDPIYFTTPPLANFSWGSPSDIAAVYAVAEQTQKWETAHGVAMFLGEFGCTLLQVNHTMCDIWYQTFREAFRGQGFPTLIWDDDGEFMTYDRATRTWNQAILKAIGLLPS